MNNQHPNLSIDNSAIYNRNISPTAVPLFIGYTEKNAGNLVEIKSFDDFKKTFFTHKALSENPNFSYSIKHYFHNGGQAAYVFSLGKKPDEPSWSNINILFDQLVTKVEAEDSVTLLAFPDICYFKNLSDWQQAWTSLLTLCQVRSGLFSVLDTPNEHEEVQQLLTQHFQGDNFGAAYWPHLKTTYTDDSGNSIKVPPSAAVIATMQQIDASKGIWSAPANIALAQVIEPSNSASIAFDSPNQRAVNPIRRFPGRGTKIWGCRTLSNGLEPASRYVQVRRLLSYCEQQLSLLAQQFLFEPNSDITWWKVKSLVDNWLHELWYQGALAGENESQAYQVKLGLGETMTQDDILAGQMRLSVLLSPTYPAEFIEMNFVFDMSSR